MLEGVKSEFAPVMKCCLTLVTGILFTDLRIVNLELMFLGKLKEIKHLRYKIISIQELKSPFQLEILLHNDCKLLWHFHPHELFFCESQENVQT